MQNTKQNEKEKRKRKSSGWRRPVVSCSPVFTFHVNNGECRRRRRKQRGRKRRRGRGRAMAGGELRELLSTVLCLCSSHCLLLLEN
jgi:hypothetical protein